MTCHTTSQELTLHSCSVDHFFEKMKEEESQQPTADAPSSSKKKGVSFFHLAEVKIVLHVDDYTDDELEACWFSVDETNKIKLRNRQYADNMLQTTPDASCTERGLEHFFSSHDKVKSCRQRSKHLVMQEQYFAKFNYERSQRTEDDREEFDEAMFELAQSYKSVAYECKKHAYMCGVKDAREAKQCWARPEMPMVQFALQQAKAVDDKENDIKHSL
ncbi:MAG: hypothetical protein SGILL_003054, partial [Bacillariaceae sp.]